MYKSQEDKPPK